MWWTQYTATEEQKELVRALNRGEVAWEDEVSAPDEEEDG